MARVFVCLLIFSLCVCYGTSLRLEHFASFTNANCAAAWTGSNAETGARRRSLGDQFKIYAGKAATRLILYGQWLTGFGDVNHTTNRIISTFDQNGETWRHSWAQDVEDCGDFDTDDRLFVASNTLHRLRLKKKERRTVVKDLLSWQDDHWEPVDIQFRRPLCNVAYPEDSQLLLNIQDPSSGEIYVGTSCYRNDGNTRLDLHKINLQASRNLRFVYINGIDLQGQMRLTAFGQLSDGDTVALANPVSMSSSVKDYVIVKIGDRTASITEQNAETPPNFVHWTSHGPTAQAGSELLFFGGKFERGRPDQSIRAFHIENFSWKDVGVRVPDNHTVVADVSGKKLFAVSYTNGIQIANIL